jgi:hypothetical protein
VRMRYVKGKKTGSHYNAMLDIYMTTDEPIESVTSSGENAQSDRSVRREMQYNAGLVDIPTVGHQKDQLHIPVPLICKSTTTAGMETNQVAE